MFEDSFKFKQFLQNLFYILVIFNHYICLTCSQKIKI